MSSKTIDEKLIPTIQYATPTTGATINVGTTGHTKLLINPAGALLALTIAMPSTPSDGDTVTLGSSQAVTTLTMSNGTIIGALTSLAIASFATYVYSTTASTWMRTG